MNQLAREDIAAVTAVHRELGSDYDDAVAESLVERIGAKIDKRVDARLGRPSDAPAQREPSRQPSRSGRASWETLPLALGSVIVGGVVSANIMNGTHGSAALVAFIWVVMAVINAGCARRR